MVSEWIGVPICQLDGLGFLEYRLYCRDAFIYRAQQSEEGRKYLDDAWLLAQTKPDREASRAAFGLRSR